MSDNVYYHRDGIQGHYCMFGVWPVNTITQLLLLLEVLYQDQNVRLYVICRVIYPFQLPDYTEQAVPFRPSREFILHFHFSSFRRSLDLSNQNCLCKRLFKFYEFMIMTSYIILFGSHSTTKLININVDFIFTPRPPSCGTHVYFSYENVLNDN